MTGEPMSVERLSTLSTTKETALNHENMCLMVRPTSLAYTQS